MITCDCCGSEINMYRKAIPNAQTLEKYASDYYKIPIAAITSVSEARKHRVFRAIVFHILIRYGQYFRGEVAKRYGLQEYRVKEMLNNLNRNYPMEVANIELFIESSLLPDEMPNRLNNSRRVYKSKGMAAA